MAIVWPDRLKSGILCALTLWVSSLTGTASADPWSYDQEEGYPTLDRPFTAPRSINPWTGEGNGPAAASPEEQFNYQDALPRFSPPPRVEDLYPGGNASSAPSRPWGAVPRHFQDEGQDEGQGGRGWPLAAPPEEETRWPGQGWPDERRWDQSFREEGSGRDPYRGYDDGGRVDGRNPWRNPYGNGRQLDDNGYEGRWGRDPYDRLHDDLGYGYGGWYPVDRYRGAPPPYWGSR